MEKAPIVELVRNRQFLKLRHSADRLLRRRNPASRTRNVRTVLPERQASPLAIAASFGILLLPYSFIGPFAGVFLDRWRRRQVLVYANWLRAVTTVLTVVIVLRAASASIWA